MNNTNFKLNNKRTSLKLFSALLAICFVFVMSTPVVYAAGSFSVSGGGTVSAGATKTITITASGCAGTFSVSASNGGKVSASSVFVAHGSTTVTVTAPSSGSTVVTVSAHDVTSDDTTSVTGSKSVTITVKTTSSSSNSSSNSSTTTTTDDRSTNANLSSLTVDKGTLSPVFAAGTTAYTVDLVDQSEITISASPADSKASVSGAGKKTLSSGANKFSVVVTAENGSKKTYTLTVNLEETPSVYSDFNGGSYGVVVDTSSVKVPSGFETSTVNIGGEEVTSWYSDNCQLELVYLVDENGDKGLYVIEAGEIISTFRSVAVLGINLYALDIPEEDQVKIGMIFGEIVVDGISLFGWTFEDAELVGYTMIQLMNESGVMVDYLYCEATTSMIEYPMDKFTDKTAYEEAAAEVVSLTTENGTLSDELSTMQTAAVAAGAVAATTTVSTGIGFTMSRGYKKDYLRVKNLFSQNNSLDIPDFDMSGAESMADFPDDIDI